ncbi:MAG: inner membrane protein [Saprospiraceae bacterium]|jgi:inner membrane protein
MDSITQAVLGAAIGKVCLGEKIGSKSILIGAAIATFPDLDVVILPFLDPLERLSMHRGFSHSILFSLLLALLLAYLLKMMKITKEVKFYRLAFFSWLTLITHILLDGFTSYGTLVFLPFSDVRFGFDSINVVDPVYSFPLLIGLLLSLMKKGESKLIKYPNEIGIVLSTLYLVATLVIKQNVDQKFAETLSAQNIQYSKIHSQPVGIASFHWYGLGRTQDGFFLGDYSYLEGHDIQFTFFPSADSLLLEMDEYTVDRMKWFAKDFYHTVEQGDSLLFYNMQVDMQGIHDIGQRNAPTRGYFILENRKGGKLISSGRH